MNFAKLMAAGVLLSSTFALGSDDTLDHLLSSFDNIEKLVKINPEQANNELKTLQTTYGAEPEFSMFADRYSELKQQIQQALQNRRPIQSQQEQPNQVKQHRVQHVKFTDVRTLKDLLPYIHPGTLVLLDIDDTVLIKSMINRQVEPIEPDIAHTINEMRQRGGIVLGLSIRSLETSDRAIGDLNSIHINYGQFAPPTIREGAFIEGNRSVGYQGGIIFAAAHSFNERGGQKGRILLEFLRRNPQLNITNVVFADDSEDNVDDVDQALKQHQISSAVFQFSGGQQRNIDIANQAQYVQFGAAPTRLEENEMAQYHINSVEELRNYKSQANQVGLSLPAYLKMIS